eukprot:9474736-Pyramimonas_sp.AAC.1
MSFLGISKTRGLECLEWLGVLDGRAGLEGLGRWEALDGGLSLQEAGWLSDRFRSVLRISSGVRVFGVGGCGVTLLVWVLGLFGWKRATECLGGFRGFGMFGGSARL